MSHKVGKEKGRTDAFLEWSGKVIQPLGDSVRAYLKGGSKDGNFSEILLTTLSEERERP